MSQSDSILYPSCQGDIKSSNFYKGNNVCSNKVKGSKMKIDNVLTKRLANSANIINTIHGGTVFPTLSTFHEDDHSKIELSLPSISPKDIKVELNGDHLFVFHMIEIQNIRIPNVIGLINIAKNIDVERISGSFNQDVLILILPKDDISGNELRREIIIDIK